MDSGSAFRSAPSKKSASILYCSSSEGTGGFRCSYRPPGDLFVLLLLRTTAMPGYVRLNFFKEHVSAHIHAISLRPVAHTPKRTDDCASQMGQGVLDDSNTI